MNATRSQREFLVWLKENDPFLYKTAEKVYDMRQSGQVDMGAVNWAGFFTSAVDTIKTAAPAVMQYKQQKDIMKMQMRRAERGLPPADVDSYTPSIRVEPVVNKETEEAMQRVATQTVKDTGKQMSNWVLPLALGAGALLLLRK